MSIRAEAIFGAAVFASVLAVSSPLQALEAPIAPGVPGPAVDVEIVTRGADAAWKLGRLSWGAVGSAGPAAGWGDFGYGWRGRDGSPSDGA